MTAQSPESIYIDNQLMSLCEEPLESYFDMKGDRPKLTWPSTALWRGYQGLWAIQDNQLYLIDLTLYLCEESSEIVDWRDLFPAQSGDIKAFWYTGTLRIPQGKLLQYIHGGYLSVYERDLFIKILNGDVIEQKIVDNEIQEIKDNDGLFDIIDDG